MGQEGPDRVYDLLLACRYTEGQKGDAADSQLHRTSLKDMTYSFRDEVSRSMDLTVLIPLDAEETILAALHVSLNSRGQSSVTY
jgi:hypothetical protein